MFERAASTRHCRAAREAWTRAFDEGLDERAGEAHGSAAPGAARSAPAAEHFAACPECAAFAVQAEAVRRELRRAPFPGPDPAADAALLAALRTARAAAETGSPGGVAGWLRRRGAIRLAAAGAGSFLATLLAAGLLSHAGQDTAQGMALEPNPPRRARVAVEVDLEAWSQRVQPVPLFRPRTRRSPAPRRAPGSRGRVPSSGETRDGKAV